ncbi:hypothetical protein ABZ848_17900 [Streptomyces sp. NPDC047081]|uniref:hypothetical protein n=1 Tax=Streptomyces sp. NPDC047081 TaxID=3154706 RepID=UPI0033E05CCB
MPLLFLNDISCATDCEPRRAGLAMTGFAKTAVAVGKLDGATALVCKVPLLEVEIAAGYPVVKWIGDPRNRDPWLRLKRMQTKAPFKAVYTEDMDVHGVEYRYDGVVADGLGGAHLTGGLGISLLVEPRWDATQLTLDRERLVEGDEIGQVSDSVDIRHVSAETHIDAHLAWIKASMDTAATTGDQLWEKIDRICPSLQFLDEVEEQVRGLQAVSVAVVRRRLLELEEAVAEWDPDTQQRPRWRGDVRGEFQTRRRDSEFRDRDGVMREFAWHTDFPPKPGRIYFRIVKEEGTVRIAHIGRKRGV